MDRSITVYVSRQRLLADADDTVDQEASWRAFRGEVCTFIVNSADAAGYPDIPVRVEAMPYEPAPFEPLAIIRIDGVSDPDRDILYDMAVEDIEWVETYGDWVRFKQPALSA
jgi:hypothetical protein